ncbi:MAG: sigma 54-interacting transcriptional regulator, partial [Gemmatimonadetes bacterium]|nr:sigma 54-interacting transcriptional regulator [Gemmatimonadota bacterium]
PRHARPFVPVDCAALPEGLLESELFGHERGAFTGAVSRRNGLLVEANGGTAFLDEITELSPGLQAKLLRALEERKVRRLGSSTLVDIAVRIVAATNANVESALAAGTFRQDLYYRLNVVHFQVPPLREREGDISLLAQSFLRRFTESLGREPLRVSPAVWDALEEYSWPGNVRELKNLAQRLVVLDEDARITLADLPPALRGEWAAGDDDAGASGVPEYHASREEALRAFRASYVRRLLALHGGNVSRAARSAGLSRRTLHRWLAEVSPLVRDRTPPA